MKRVRTVVYRLHAAGIFPGDQNLIRPAAETTRAEAAGVLAKVLNYGTK